MGRHKKNCECEKCKPKAKELTPKQEDDVLEAGREKDKAEEESQHDPDTNR